MDANADVNLLGCFLLGVVAAELSLDLLSALYGVDDGGKVHQKGITHGFDHRAMMGSHSLLNHLIMNVKQPQRDAGFRSAQPSLRLLKVNGPGFEIIGDSLFVLSPSTNSGQALSKHENGFSAAC